MLGISRRIRVLFKPEFKYTNDDKIQNKMKIEQLKNKIYMNTNILYNIIVL